MSGKYEYFKRLEPERLKARAIFLDLKKIETVVFTLDTKTTSNGHSNDVFWTFIECLNSDKNQHSML